MGNLAVLTPSDSHQREPRVQLLLADDDAPMRSLLELCARDAVEAVTVLEASDGAEAIQLGLQQRPQIALLDINMPRLGGIEVAVTLRALQPQMRLALHTAEPHAYRDRARVHHLPLFDKLELDRTLGWLDAQVKACANAASPELSRKRTSLECSSCGYGVCCSKPPERCPMCHVEDVWVDARWRPFRRGVASV